MSNPSTVDARADMIAGGGRVLLPPGNSLPGPHGHRVSRAERHGAADLSTSTRSDLGICSTAPLMAVSGRAGLSSTFSNASNSACKVRPAWTVEDARGWWRDRGPAALEVARAQREERTQLMLLASESGGGRRS
jgi:hypothetical protein